MKEGGRANALLVELLIVIFFFMIAATTLVELFAAAKLKSMEAKALNNSMLEGQNLADELYGSSDPEKLLEARGFTQENETWVMDYEGYTMKIIRREEESESGSLVSYDVTSYQGEKQLISLPATRYIPKEVSP
jgi:hypothetical protein